MKKLYTSPEIEVVEVIEYGFAASEPLGRSKVSQSFEEEEF
ncbi:hypothetical protein [Dysgonomonas sp. 511]|nr:hypothetical protein [Dysgonomonas sp. 511]